MLLAMPMTFLIPYHRFKLHKWNYITLIKIYIEEQKETSKTKRQHTDWKNLHIADVIMS